MSGSFTLLSFEEWKFEDVREFFAALINQKQCGKCGAKISYHKNGQKPGMIVAQERTQGHDNVHYYGGPKHNPGYVIKIDLVGALYIDARLSLALSQINPKKIGS